LRGERILNTVVFGTFCGGDGTGLHSACSQLSTKQKLKTATHPLDFPSAFHGLLPEPIELFKFNATLGGFEAQDHLLQTVIANSVAGILQHKKD
jgi:hypothetical protein